MTTELRTYVFAGIRQDSSPGPTFSDFKLEIEAHTAADALVMYKVNTKADAKMCIPMRPYRLRRMWVKPTEVGPTADAERARRG